MNELVHRAKQSLSGNGIFASILFPAMLSVLVALGLYGYLGTFSRYTSDDYCLSAFYLQDMDFASSMVDRYVNDSSRYTNILFIGFADKVLGWYNPAILPPLMIALLVLGLYLFIDQIQKLAQLRWNRSVSFYLAALLAYLSIVQAPDLYQTLYWRAGMTSHFAPVVFMPFLGAFIVQHIRLAQDGAPSAWVYVLCFVIPFLIGGLSEPPATLMITILVLALAAVWLWVKTPARRSILSILAWALVGATTALIVLAFAPANILRVGETQTNLPALVWSILYKPLLFIIDNVQTLPLPILFSIVFPGLLSYLKYSAQAELVSGRRLAWLILAVWLIGYVLIASAFAPSIYGQSYPAARARFSGVVLLTVMFMLTGLLLGRLAASAKFLRSSAIQIGIMIVFVLISLYPLRTTWRLSAEIPVYQQRATVWDERDAGIRAMKADGVTDITVHFLSEDAVQDLGDRREFRLNRCAASLYEVNSILAVPRRKE